MPATRNPLATAVLESMLVAASSDLARLAGCNAPSPARNTVALRRMLTGIRRGGRAERRGPVAVDQSTHAAIEPECADQATQTDKDISGFDGHTRALSGQQTLAVREQREALAAQQQEHRTYRRALQRIVETIADLQSQNESLAANAECAWRLARSRGLLGDSEDGALLSAWSGSLRLPPGFGYTTEVDTDKVLADVQRSLEAAEAERKAWAVEAAPQLGPAK